MAGPHATERVAIKTANANDLPVLIPLINNAFAEETFLEGTRTDEIRLAAILQKGDLLIAEWAGQVVACVYVELRGERAYFGMLAVDPAQRGKGFGRLMTGAAERYARHRGCRHMEIGVLSLRPDLLPFYRAMGYAETGDEPFLPSRPLKDGVKCHCIVMSKRL